MIIDLARMPDSIAFFPHGRRVYAVMTIEHYESLAARAVAGERAAVARGSSALEPPYRSPDPEPHAAADSVGPACGDCGSATEFHSVNCPTLDGTAPHGP